MKKIAQQFRKKPVVIEAIQFKGDKESFEAIWDWACPSNDTLKSPVHCGNDETGADDYGVLHIGMLKGDMKATRGDWIIKGVKGGFYPCKPDIFEATYEKVK